MTFWREIGPICQKADSEIRTHDGALQDDFSEQDRSWDDSGTIISETYGSYQSFMGSRMPDLPLIPRMDRTLHTFWQNNIGKAEKEISQQVLGKEIALFKKIQRPK